MRANLRQVAISGLLIIWGVQVTPTPLLAAAEVRRPASERVKLLKTPREGVQPQAVVDGEGTVHLVYVAGKPSGCDIFYTHLDPGQEAFAAPVRVNSQPGAAVATGTIRGAHLALGRNGRVHVAWNGSGEARPRSRPRLPPMLYSRSNRAIARPSRRSET